jgi:hypothetical protein
MKRCVFFTVLCVVLSFLTTGCYTDLAVNIKNGTGTKVLVKSEETGKEIGIAPKRSEKILHSSGNLVVSAFGGERFTFEDITPATVDRKYLEIGGTIIGPGKVTLNVLLETNMQIYVLMPGGSPIDRIQQPKGYPKIGTKND